MKSMTQFISMTFDMITITKCMSLLKNEYFFFLYIISRPNTHLIQNGAEILKSIQTSLLDLNIYTNMIYEH